MFNLIDHNLVIIDSNDKIHNISRKGRYLPCTDLIYVISLRLQFPKVGIFFKI